MSLVYPSVSRRRFLGGITAAGGAAMIPSGGGLLAQPSSSTRRGVIDTHHHFWAPDYLKAQVGWEDQRKIFHYPGMMSWTPQVSLREMDRGGVQTSILSIASLWDSWFGFKPPEASRLARGCCDYAAELMRDHPGRFGLFAPLSMLDTDLTLKEIEYALDTLKADGIGLQTSYGDRYAGDPFFRPVLEELNRRKAVVCFHGSWPGCCSNMRYGLGASAVEVTTDTTRTIISLLTSGSFARYRDIKWIMPYGGGDVPMLASRIDNFARQLKNYKDFAPNGLYDELKRLHYDTVNVVTQPAWGSMQNFIPMSQIVYGTDYPYYNNDQLNELDNRGLSAQDKDAIFSGNAKRLLPRLANA
jgi:predicted TIM-barrel fold metal-dependent hydrolase